MSITQIESKCFANKTGWIRHHAWWMTVAVLCSVALLVTGWWRTSAQGLTGLTMNDSENVPGPGDNLLVVVKSSGTYAITLSRDTNTAYTHRLESDSTLTPIGTSPTGDGPLAIALARGGDLAIVANSRSNDLSVMTINASGLLEEQSRVPSGGILPSDVDAAYDDLVIVANRGALTGEGEGVTLFSVDRNGNMEQIGELMPTGTQPPLLTGGNDPHIVTVSRDGVVVVANSSSNDLTLFDVSRSGDINVLPPPSRSVGGSPKALSMSGRRLYVATRSNQFGVIEDQIEQYLIDRDGTMTQLSSTNAGYFVTDIEANEDGLFTVTWGSTTGALEVRAYDINAGSGLSLSDSLQLPNVGSFQQVATHPGRRRGNRHVLVTQFQANSLHSVTHQK